MTPVVRFAPSPTGRLHIGNVRTAVLNWLFARKNGGSVVLRLDDTDAERVTEAYADDIRRDLAWLGLVWDREERQALRTARYAEAAAALKAAGRLYPCYETEEDLERKRRSQALRHLPPLYDREALRLTDEQRRQYEAEGRRPHWRFLLANADPGGAGKPVPTLVHWNDLVRADQSVDISSLSDPVLIRVDGTCLYTFSSVVDDIDFGITHVIRGEDHVTNTGVQIQIFEALGASPPAFAHHGLLVDVDGKALSKRMGSLSLERLREDGLEPMAIVSHAALIGTSEPLAAHADIRELEALFDFAKLSRTPARFDIDQLRMLNGRLLHGMDYAKVESRLQAMGVGGDAAFWTAVRGNLTVLQDAKDWWQVVAGEIAPIIEEEALLAAAADVLPDEPWNETTWASWTAQVAARTGRKGRALYHPLRLALTGREAGPELKVLLPLMGRERALSRLRGARA